MNWKFLHRKTDPLTGRSSSYVNRHPTIEMREGLYEALKPIARKRGLTVNQLIASETHTLLMNILLEDTE